MFLEGGFPVSLLNPVKSVPEICRILCATANPVEVVMAETERGRTILGIVDGRSSLGVETEQDVAERKALPRHFGYRL